MAWRMKGEYLKNCSCVPGCPCDAHGFPAPHEFCEGVVAMNIAEGESLAKVEYTNEALVA